MNRKLLLQLGCLAACLAAPAATRAQSIAVYGAENGLDFGSSLNVYGQSGGLHNELLFQHAAGSSTYEQSFNIEDIAYDAAGNLYAVGKANGNTARTIFKSAPGLASMNILFQTNQAYDSTVDGSIAISPTGDIAVYGAASVSGFGSSVRIYNQAGTQVNELLFQNSVGGSSFGVDLNVEDIAYDSAGNVYAVGKPNSSTARTIWKWMPGQIAMYVLFQKDLAYDASVDGSIAISPTGTIAVYGAQSVQTFGSSVKIFDQTGTVLHEMLFQTSVGGFSWGVSKTIEDIAFDAAGSLYAVGQTAVPGTRTIFKSSVGFSFMNVLFQADYGFTSSVDGSIAIAHDGAWSDLGSSLKGVLSLPPLLQCSGTLAANSSNQLDLSFAKPSAVATLVFGLSAVNAPFKGGVFVPDALVTIPVATTASGTASLPFVFPAGVPSGTSLYFQYWIPDAAGVQGFAASNAMKGVTP